MTDPARPGQPPPPPPPATPPPAAPPPAGGPAPAGGQNWGTQGSTPEWAQQTQNWRPAEVAAGPAPGVAYADLVNRIVAYIIDAILLGVVNIIVFTILAAIAFGGGGFFVFAVIGAVASLIISAVYFIYTWTRMRASPGQRILSLMTVNEADGATLTQEQAIRRWAFLYGPFAISSVFSLGGFGAGSVSGGGSLSLLVSLLVFGYAIYLLYTTANHPKRQGFHDQQARSVVVKTGP